MGYKKVNSKKFDEKESKRILKSYEAEEKKVNNFNKKLLNKIPNGDLINILSKPLERNIVTERYKVIVEELNGIKNRTKQQDFKCKFCSTKLNICLNYQIFRRLVNAVINDCNFISLLSLFDFEELTNKEKKKLKEVKKSVLEVLKKEIK